MDLFPTIRSQFATTGLIRALHQLCCLMLDDDDGTDRMLRAYLGKSGKKKGDGQLFVEKPCTLGT